MALAYTAPTWENGGGVGISASQLQALCDCMEGLVQGSDKAITNIAISGQTITLTFADGSVETETASGLKGISSIAKTGTSGLVDTYTITFTDGSTSTFTVTNGAQGEAGPAGPQGPQGEQGIQGPAGADGEDGVSPEVTITAITGGHKVTITDADHPTGQDFDVMDGANTVVPNPQGTSVGDLTSISINGDKYDIQGGGGTDENAYHIGDTAETTLADDDYFPFYDTSASAKRKTLWSNIKSVLSNLFVKMTAIATNEPNSTASQAYAAGEHFYKNGKFCTAKTAIASGATFTLGTNYVEGTVADNLSKRDLLWTNPNIVISTSYNPNVTFAAQSLDAVTNLMDYDYFAIDVLLHTFRNYMNTVIIPNDVYSATVNWVMVNIISPSPSGNFLARRNIAFDGSTHKLTFSSGMYLPSYGGASTTDDNHFIVPYKIYGIKL